MKKRPTTKAAKLAKAARIANRDIERWLKEHKAEYTRDFIEHCIKVTK